VTGFVVVLCTCESEQQASSIANAVVERRLAACVNVLSGVRSVYRWQEKIETAVECLLLIKTSEDRYAALEEAVMELHSYENPELIALPIVRGAEKYLDWIRENV
jgi:periplasmic divalent cation tolerance protein